MLHVVRQDFGVCLVDRQAQVGREEGERVLSEEDWEEEDEEFAWLLVRIHTDGQVSDQLATPATIAG